MDKAVAADMWSDRGLRPSACIGGCLGTPGGNQQSDENTGSA